MQDKTKMIVKIVTEVSTACLSAQLLSQAPKVQTSQPTNVFLLHILVVESVRYTLVKFTSLAPQPQELKNFLKKY